jgi:hypothetical protein
MTGLAETGLQKAVARFPLKKMSSNNILSNSK